VHALADVHHLLVGIRADRDGFPERVHVENNPRPRATELVRMFIDRYQVEPNRLSAAGFAEYHPVDDNAIPEGRARNRRIDIVILNPALQEKSPFATPPAAPVPLAPPAGPSASAAASAASASPAPARR